jgi:hypothetical protein
MTCSGSSSGLVQVTLMDMSVKVPSGGERRGPARKVLVLGDLVRLIITEIG